MWNPNSNSNTNTDPQTGADATYCLDKCNGYYGAVEAVPLGKNADGEVKYDEYMYRYYMTGETSDQVSAPTNPDPDPDPDPNPDPDPDHNQVSVPTSPIPVSDPAESSFYPFTPLCALGCGMNGASWDASWLPNCAETAIKGYSFTDNLLDPGDLIIGATTQYTSGSKTIPSPKKVCDALTISDAYDTSKCVASTAGSTCSVACASGSYGDYATYTCTSDKGVGTWSGTAPTCTSGTKPFVAPNILLIQPDDMYQGYSAGWEAPSDPGFSLPVADAGLTTNIDKIGAEGAVFTRAYTASGMCSPSRMALLTGRYASRGAYEIEVSGGSAKTAKVTVPNSKMHGNDLTHNLPQALKLAGYKTGHIGKW